MSAVTDLLHQSAWRDELAEAACDTRDGGGFYNELELLLAAVGDVQAAGGDERYAHTDPEVQRLMAVCDPLDFAHFDLAQAEDAYTACWDRLSGMLKGAIRRGLAEHGRVNAEDTRGYLATRVE